MNDSNEKWSQLFSEIEELKSEIKKNTRPANEVILDDVDLREMLKVSKRTTAMWRQKKLIKHSWLEGKVYYKLSDVLDALERNAIKPISKSLKVKL